MAVANKTTMDAEIQAFAEDVRQSIAQARRGEVARVRAVSVGVCTRATNPSHRPGEVR